MKTLAVALILAMPGAAVAGCPPLSAYSVTGLSADKLPLSEALGLLFEGTAWKPEVSSPVADVRVTFRDVGGQLDQVFTTLIEQAGRATPEPMSALRDPTRCVATVSLRRLAPVASSNGASAPAALPDRDVLPAGSSLSEALEKYVQRRGWKLRWLIEDDYTLDVDLPVVGKDVIEGVTSVVRTYQAQGGMQGIVPRFAKGNSVVVIEKMDVRGN